MTRDEAMGFSAAFRCRLDDTRYIFDEISAGLATKVEYQKHIKMRNHWEELVAMLESEDISDIGFDAIEKELNESLEFEKMPKDHDDSLSYEEIVESMGNIKSRTDALESTTDDMILLMADLIGGN